MKREDVAEQIGEDALFADGFDGALIGFVQRYTSTVALYDYEKCIAILITEEGMEEEDAREHFEYNVIGAWVGEMTPAFATLNYEGTGEVKVID